MAALRTRGLWHGADSTRPTRPRSVTEIALELARGQAWARPGVRETYFIADYVRSRFRFADRLRQAATAAGGTERAWDALDHAARFEREALAIEAEINEALA